MFGLNFSKSSANSKSESDAYGYTLGGSTSLSDSRSSEVARAGSQSSSTQDIAFADLFQKLYGGALGATGRAAEQLPGLSDAARTLFASGTGFLDKLGASPGADYLEGRATGENPVLDEQIGNLSEDVGRFFREELNPAIKSQAVGTGQLGGGRQGVAQTGAARVAGEQFVRGATELRSRDQAARDAAAGTAGQLRLQAGGAQLSALPGLYGLAEAGVGGELSLYERLAGVLGGPTTLTTAGSTSFSESDSEAIARAIAQSFNIGEDTAHSESTSTQKSKSFGLSFGPK
jgi:hypothetical protein